MTRNMASAGLREDAMLTKIILTTDGTIGCVKSDTWCQMVGAGQHTYLCCMLSTQAVSVVSIIVVIAKFSLRPDEAMLLVMNKVSLFLQKILFYLTFREYI